jgi:hypothetical protein
MSKLSLQVGSKEFDISLDGDFYEYFKGDFNHSFKDKKNIDIKELLQAFVQKSYNEYQDKLKLEEISKKLEKF